MSSKKPVIQDHKSFKQIYKKYWPLVYRVCYSKTKDREGTEEMVQDIFISLWRRRKNLVIDTSLEHYLIKAGKLRVIDYYRKKYNGDKVESIDEVSLQADIGNYNEALYGFLHEDLQLVVSQLPGQCQKVYRMSREDQLSNREISDLLSISEKTVKNHLTKALNYIRKELKHSLLQ